MKKKIAVLLSTMLVVVMLAISLASCASGVYYTLNSDGQLNKEGPTVIFSTKTIQMVNKDGIEYFATCNKKGEESYKYDGKEYKTIRYSLKVTKLKMKGNEYKFDKNGNIKGDINNIEKTTIKLGVKAFEAIPVFYNSDGGILFVGGIPYFKKPIDKK